MNEAQPLIGRDRLEGVASSLGIEPGARTEGQIKLDIARALVRAPQAQVISSARSLGVNLLGGDVESLKRKIIKALSI